MDKENIKKKIRGNYMDGKTYWQSREKRALDSLDSKRKDDITNPYAVDYHMKKRDFLYIASSTMAGIKFLVLADILDKAEELIDLGETYIKKAIEIGDRNTGVGKRLSPERAECARKYLYYEYTWFKTKKEDKKILEDIYNIDIALVEEDRKRKSYMYLADDRRDLIYDAFKIGEFETARKYVWEWAKKKPSSNRIKSNIDVIFDEKYFMILIAGYLASPEKNKDLYPKIMKCYDKFFEEKYNDPLIIGQGYRTLHDQINFAYIKYKYFSEEDVKLDPIEVIQSLRYGYRYKYK